MLTTRRWVSAVVGPATVVVLALAGSQGPAVAERSVPEAEPGPKVERFVPQSPDNKRLKASWKRWVEARGPRYTTRVARACGECGSQPPVISTAVRRQRLVAVKNADTGKTVGWGQAYPMDRLYRLLRRGYAKAEHVYVKYDKRGVPISIAINWSDLIADEETYLTVRAQTED
jgi:hypothetical protein